MNKYLVAVVIIFLLSIVFGGTNCGGDDDDLFIPSPTPTLSSTSTPTPTPDPNSTPSPTSTPAPASTPAPTSTPDPNTPSGTPTPSSVAFNLGSGGGYWDMSDGAGGYCPETVNGRMSFIPNYTTAVVKNRALIPNAYEVTIDRDLTWDGTGRIDVYLPDPYDVSQNYIVFEIYNGSEAYLGSETIASSFYGSTQYAELTGLVNYTGERKFIVYFKPPE